MFMYAKYVVNVWKTNELKATCPIKWSHDIRTSRNESETVVLRNADV